jgi:hypothetical protein
MVVKLTPKWNDASKPGNDRNGYVRGAIGCDGLLDADGDEFMRTFDKKPDKKMYGPTIRSPRIDGAQTVMTSARDPGNLHDDFKGYRGVDGDGGTQ